VGDYDIPDTSMRAIRLAFRAMRGEDSQEGPGGGASVSP
jgi:hypothetical protein